MIEIYNVETGDLVKTFENQKEKITGLETSEKFVNLFQTKIID